MCRQDVQIVIRWSIRPSAFQAGADCRTMLPRAKPLSHHMLLTRHPACIELKCRRATHAGDGRSPDLRVAASPNLPGQLVQWSMSGSLAAHSCGGSHGFGALGRGRTVFPFHLVSLWRPRTITRIKIATQWNRQWPIARGCCTNTCNQGLPGDDRHLKSPVRCIGDQAV